MLGTKVTSQTEFFALRNTLRVWSEQLWLCSTNANPHTTVEALRISIAILHLPFSEQESFELDIGSEIRLFIAALVVWAATIAAETRLTGSRAITQQSDLTLVSQSSTNPTRELPSYLFIPSKSSSLTRLQRLPELHHDPRSYSALTTSLDGKPSM